MGRLLAGATDPAKIQAEAQEHEHEGYDGRVDPQGRPQERDTQQDDGGEEESRAQQRPPRPDLAATIGPQDDREAQRAVSGAVGGGGVARDLRSAISVPGTTASSLVRLVGPIAKLRQ